jgi:hypothetical protein
MSNMGLESYLDTVGKHAMHPSNSEWYMGVKVVGREYCKR